MSRFDDFWKIWPRKEAKAEAIKAWGKNGCDEKADIIIAHVEKRSRTDPKWLGSQKFIPMPATFLNQGRWEDQFETVEEARNADEKRDAKKYSQRPLDFDEVRRAVKMLILRNYRDAEILNTFAITPHELSVYRQKLIKAHSVLNNDFERQNYWERPKTELVEVKL